VTGTDVNNSTKTTSRSITVTVCGPPQQCAPPGNRR
jgi:hypothetical protein